MVFRLPVGKNRRLPEKQGLTFSSNSVTSGYLYVTCRKGKKGLIGLFVGEVKKISAGKADPRLTTEILLKKLNQS